MTTDMMKRWDEAQHLLAQAQAAVKGLDASVAEAKTGLADAHFASFDEDLVSDFLDEPYILLPKKAQEWYVVVPRFVKLQVGWLERSTPSFNVFLVNKYMNWLAQVPSKLKAQFDFQPELPVQVEGGIVTVGEGRQEEVLSRYKDHLAARVGSDKIRVKRGHEFDLIAAMIGDGTLPFRPRPVDAADMRLPRWMKPIVLRDYQQEAWDTFLKTGAIGAFMPFGTGKSILGLWAVAHIKPPHAIVVPTLTLREQWQNLLATHIGEQPTVVTYQAYEKMRDVEWNLLVFDECHRLPANTYSRLATIRTKYRVGLSATPYREDGRTDYIFALTGFPVGLDWTRLEAAGYLNRPEVTLYVVEAWSDKLRRLETLLRDPVKTIVFCDGIDRGARIANAHNVPHIHGETKAKDRLPELKAARVAVVSRVGDEGVSLPDIRRVIEVDFHAGSRRQEAQRMGRLFHGESPGQHIIIMTERELEDHEKRLLAIYEKGFDIKVVRG